MASVKKNQCHVRKGRLAGLVDIAKGIDDCGGCTMRDECGELNTALFLKHMETCSNPGCQRMYGVYIRRAHNNESETQRSSPVFVGRIRREGEALLH